MKPKTIKKLTVVGGVAVMMAIAPAAAVADFPERDIRYIVPYSAGGQSDVTAREITEIVRNKGLIPTNMQVSNVDGASAGTGMIEVRDAAPDGYTLLHHHTSLITHQLTGVRDWGYEAYTPIAQLFEVPAAIVVPNDSPFETFDELVEHARENPGDLTWNTSSLGGGTHMFTELVQAASDTSGQFGFVAYGSGEPSIRAILAGEDDVTASSLPQVMQQVREGQMRMLAVTTDDRLEQFPDVPTLAEMGYEIPLTATHRMGVWGPPDLPDDIVAQLEELFQTVIESEEFAEAADRHGVNPNFADGQTLVANFDSDRDVLAELIAQLESN
jgi:tripartite-type tricarboxylate transporter receptor subunit TctC